MPSIKLIFINKKKLIGSFMMEKKMQNSNEQIQKMRGGLL